MSRTEEDIASGVDITIMRDTFRPPLACARRTNSGRERFIDFLVPGSVRSRFVAEHASDGLRQAGLGESGGIHIADRDVAAATPGLRSGTSSTARAPGFPCPRADDWISSRRWQEICSNCKRGVLWSASRITR